MFPIQSDKWYIYIYICIYIYVNVNIYIDICIYICTNIVYNMYIYIYHCCKFLTLTATSNNTPWIPLASSVEFGAKSFTRCTRCFGTSWPSHTVDGSEIRRSPVDMVIYPIIYRVLYIPTCAGFLPATVSQQLLGSKCSKQKARPAWHKSTLVCWAQALEFGSTSSTKQLRNKNKSWRAEAAPALGVVA